MGGWLMVERCGEQLQKRGWEVQWSAEAVSRAGGEAALRGFMAKQAYIHIYNSKCMRHYNLS